MTVFIDDLFVGAELPPLVKVATPQHLVRYAAAADDYSQIILEDAYARARGLDGVVVNSLLKAAFLAQVVTEWCGDRGWVKAISVEYHGTDRPNRPIVCRGHVDAVRLEEAPGQAEIVLWTVNSHGETTTTGRATVAFEDPFAQGLPTVRTGDPLRGPETEVGSWAHTELP